MKYFISIISFLLFMSCHKENEIVGKWQIIDIQFEEVDTIGLAGLVFTTLSEHLSRPTTLLVESDSIYMFVVYFYNQYSTVSICHFKKEKIS